MQDEKTRWKLFAMMFLVFTAILILLCNPPGAARDPVSGISFSPFVSFDLQIQDRLMASLPASKPLENLAFLGIDESSMRVANEDPEIVNREPGLQLMAQSYPWSRELWARTAQRLIDAGAKLVILDLLFSNPREGDEALRKVIEAHPDRILLVSSIEEPGKSQLAGEMLRYSEPVETIAWDFDFLINNVGYSNFFPNPGGMIREVLYRTTLMELSGSEPHPDEEVFESISAVTLRHLGKDEVLNSGRDQAFVVRFPTNPDAVYPILPLYEIFWPSLWEANYGGGDFFKDKTVIVGPAANQFQDIHKTPSGDLLGPQLHLSAISAAANGSLYKRAAPGTNVFITILCGLFALGVTGYFRHPFQILISLIGGVLAFWFFAWLTLLNSHYLLGLLGPLGAMLLTGGGALAADHAHSFKERALLRRALERRVSKEVMDEILADPYGYLNELGGVRREVCVLFSDLRGFTSMSENSAPEDVLAQLNQYFDVMVENIQVERGMVDKFIGDAIMAIWGCVPSLDRKEASRLTTQSALRMARALPELNQQFEKTGYPQLKIGIGIHSGEAITGNLGSEKRLELTAIGDAVNLASRLEGVTKRYGVQLVVSEAVAADLDESWLIRPLDRVKVVGRKAPITIYEPLGLPDDSDAMRKEAAAIAKPFTEAFELYQKEKFEKAAQQLEAFLKSHPEDVPAMILLERCREFAVTPPESPWDGSITLTSK